MQISTTSVSAHDPKRRVLKDVFGFDDFRPGQASVMEALLAGRHVLAVMPTGAGKSLCYQVPALVKGGLTIVVSPLVALMQDQVAALRLAGVAADTINSSIDRDANVAAWRRVASGQTRLDALILKLDLAANTIVASIKTGTASSGGGALPALTQNDTTWEHLLRVITVPGGVAALVSGNIGPVTPPTGLRVVPYVGAPPALTGVPRALGLDLTSKRLSYWDGAAWVALTAAVAWADITGKPATFSPSAHSHTIADITDIASATVANALKVGGRTIFVQSGTPTGAVAGDLWFW